MIACCVLLPKLFLVIAKLPEIIIYISYFVFLSVFQRASVVAQMVKNRPAMWETWVQSLGWEHPLEERMKAHSSILAWRIPMDKEPGGLQSMGSQRVRHD